MWTRQDALRKSRPPQPRQLITQWLAAWRGDSTERKEQRAENPKRKERPMALERGRPLDMNREPATTSEFNHCFFFSDRPSDCSPLGGLRFEYSCGDAGVRCSKQRDGARRCLVLEETELLCDGFTPTCAITLRS